MLPLNWSYLTGLIKAAIPYLIAIVVTIALYLFIQHKWHESMTAKYNAGVQDGKEAVANDYAEKASQLRNNWAIDKGKLEYEAQQRLNAANADAAASRDASDSLQRTLDEVRGVARSAGVSVTASTSTGKAVDLLADMLVKSNRRANTYADFADRAFEAGRTCELQYDAMRKRIDEAKSNDKRADTSSSQADTSSTRIRDVP